VLARSRSPNSKDRREGSHIREHNMEEKQCFAFSDIFFVPLSEHT
jgi:hypothetical protein